MELLLFLISLVLRRLLEPFMYIYNSIVALYKGNWKQYNKNLAIAIDQYGNGLCSHLFNQILIKRNNPSSHLFGNIDETISSVIGKNKITGTLTGLGRFIDWVLDSLEKDHSIKAIDNTEN